MATNTTNYNWTKPDYEDDADIKDLNDNFDGIDAQVKAIDEQVQLNKNNISLVADQSTKYNLISPTGSGSGHGFTVTYNNDGTFTVNGTRPSGDTNSAWISIGKVTLPSDSYVMHGATGQAQLAISVGGTTYYAAISPATFSGAVNDSTLYIHVPAAVQSLNNVVVKPIIIKKSLYDAGFTAYQPYALSNVELTEKVVINENAFSTTSMASLIYNEAIAQGIDTNNTLTYILSVRTDTDNEYVCAYGVYKHGVMHRCVAMVNNTITISAFNNLGTIALSGGTAPYYAKVKFF